jgi:hypothetical protein
MTQKKDTGFFSGISNFFSKKKEKPVPVATRTV